MTARAVPDREHAHRARAGLIRSAGVVGLATMSSRVLGLVRDLVLAHVFGASHQLDAYTVAFRFPNLFRDLFAEGAMSAAFVPTFMRVLTAEGRAAAWRLGNLVITTLLLVTGAIALLGIVFAWPLVQFAASHYATVPGKLALTVTLARVMFPFLTLIAIAAGLMGMQNSLRRFFVPAFSPAMFNIGTLVTMAVLIPVFRATGVRPILAVAIGTLVGGLGQAAIQWPGLRSEGFRFRLRVDWRDPRLREVLVLMGPGTMALAAVQINIMVNTMLATSQGEGAATCLNFAFRVMYLPIGLFGLSVATAALPALSHDAARNDSAGFRETFSGALRMMLVLNVPATLGLLALASPIVALLFEHGSFTAAAARGTAAALVCYAPGLIGYSTVKLVAPTFYALRDSRTPAAVAAVTVVINAVLSLLLARLLGFPGLALGTALASLFNASALLWLLRRRLGSVDGRRILATAGKVTLAALVMAAAAWSGERAVEVLVPGASTVAKLAHVAAGIGVGLIVLVAAARALRVTEFDEALRAVRDRLFAPKTA